MRPGAGRGIGAGVKRKGNGRRYAGCMPMAWVHRTETVREDGDVWDVDRPIRYLSVTRLQIKVGIGTPERSRWATAGSKRPCWRDMVPRYQQAAMSEGFPPQARG